MIRIIVAGTTGSGKTAVAILIKYALSILGAKVVVADAVDTLQYSVADAKMIISDHKPDVLISTLQLNRTASPEQIEKATLTLPA